MTLGFYSLGSVADLWDAAYSGFDYPNNAQLVPLLSDGTSTRNAVLQQSGLGFRQAALAFVAEGADANTIRGYYESRESVEFVDFAGYTSDVRILEFSRALKFSDVWDVTVVMIEISDPVAP